MKIEGNHRMKTTTQFNTKTIKYKRELLYSNIIDDIGLFFQYNIPLLI